MFFFFMLNVLTACVIVFFYLHQQCAFTRRTCYCASVTFRTRTLFFLSVCLERKWSLNKKKQHFHLLPPLTMDRTLNNTSFENPNSKHFPPKEFTCTCIEMASFSVSVLGRHGKSPACPHLWAGRSHWAPQGKRQSQVLSRVRGRNADLSFPENL